MRFLLLAALLLCACPAAAQDAAGQWPLGSLTLLQQVQRDPESSFKVALDLGASFYPTSDGESFAIAWVPPDKELPTKWIVSLPGTQGFATRDFALWVPYLRQRGLGFISLQWWLGGADDAGAYYSPQEVYREINTLLRDLQIQPGNVLLHGFSRGATILYPVAAMDRVRGKRYASLYVAHAGGAVMTDPATRAITEGSYGKTPFAYTQWITVCGAKDPLPNHDGCPAMQRTATWLTSLNAEILLDIEDPRLGHGALHLNPANMRKVLDYFENPQVPIDAEVPLETREQE